MGVYYEISRRNQDDKRVHTLVRGVLWCSPLCGLPVVGAWLLADGGTLAYARGKANASDDKCMVMGCRRDCRNNPSTRDTPSRD
jgi:hypothetical protein